MNKKNILIICGFILAIIFTAVITVMIVKNTDSDSIITNEVSKEDKATNKEKEKTEEAEKGSNNSEEIIDDLNNPSNTIKDEKVPNKQDKDNTTSNKTEIKQEDNVVIKTEADVVNYLEDVSESSASITLKEGFVTVIDFLFYDGEIYGKTFKELSNATKIKAITLALKIDSKIDEYFPDYKEKISTTTNKVYTSIKSKLITLYLDTTVKICNNNPTLCEEAKAGLSELKNNFGLTWDFIKDITGIGFTKLKRLV